MRNITIRRLIDHGLIWDYQLHDCEPFEGDCQIVQCFQLGPIFELESVEFSNEFSNKLDDLIRLPRVLANKFRGL
jgi:hypothetical protein